MNKKKIVVGVAMGILSMALVFPKTSSAFWPFDKWFQQGEVMGERTDSSKRSFSVRSLFVRTTITPTPSSEEKEVDEEISESKIKQLAAKRRISETQRKALMVKLADIKAARLQVKSLQADLVAWLKENKINQKDISEEKTETPSTDSQSGSESQE